MVIFSRNYEQGIQALGAVRLSWRISITAYRSLYPPPPHIYGMPNLAPTEGHPTPRRLTDI